MTSDEKNTNETPDSDKNKNKRRIISCCFGTAIMMAGLVVIAMLAIPPFLGAHRNAWQSRAKGTLRSISSSQEEFRVNNKEGSFGTFKELKNDLYIAEPYNLGNMIENYTMTWDVRHITTAQTEGISLGVMNSFTITAFPMDTRPGYLNTFAVTEDQVVRVYTPDNDNDVTKVKTWDPIL